MTKAQIIQRLLDEKQITVEEAMTLMAQDPIPMPVNPYAPPYTIGDPDWTWDPNRMPIWYTTHTNTNPVFETSDKTDV